jgi:recombinational DNA repair protein (RecF pathway)
VCGYYAAELLLNFTAEGQPCPQLHQLCLESLRRFEQGQSLGLSVLLLEIGALRDHGSCPTFDVCVECDHRLRRTGALLFSPAHGGPLCVRCGRALYQGTAARSLHVQAPHVAFLADLCAESPTPAARPGVTPQQIVAASRILRSLMTYVLGKQLRMWKYLQDRHLSKTLSRIKSPAHHATTPESP